MSFLHTVEALLAGRKTVTRRLGWQKLKAGDRFLAVRQCRGIPKGQRQQVLGECEAVSVSEEPLALITASEVAAEGFPDWTASRFII